jgi:16S rRNA (cytosine967-C5)-methyltransferase
LSSILHFHLVNGIHLALNEIFIGGKYADKVIEKLFKLNKKWGSRDRKFFAETVYEIVRHKRLLSYCAESEDSWKLIAAYFIKSKRDLPDWKEFKNINVDIIKKRISDEKPIEIENSFPDWLNELGYTEFKSDWPEIMKSLNKPADVYLRTNTLVTETIDLLKVLEAEGIETEKVTHQVFQFPEALRLTIRKNVFVTSAFKKGMFEVQDAASQLVAPLMDLRPGLRVADACAGAGGKSLHIAALMKNKGKLISMDIHEWKLKELKIRAARNKVDIIETKLIESNKTIKRLENSFDRVLLDVPCSGTGVLRRNPDTKWKLSENEISRLCDLQKEILVHYSKMLKPNGKLVYATCSILNRENEDQVNWFLKQEAGKSFNLEKSLRVWPHRDGFDGFFAALLSKG